MSTEEDPVKQKINEQSEKINQQSKVIDSLTKENIHLATEVKQLRVDISDIARKEAAKMLQALGIPVDDNGNVVQQAQPQPQQEQPQQERTQEYIPPNVQNITSLLSKDVIIALKDIAIAGKEVVQALGLMPEPSDEITALHLMNKKRFDEWNAKLVNKVLGEAIAYTSDRFHIKIEPESTIREAVHEITP